jgi:hypothetical protein
VKTDRLIVAVLAAPEAIVASIAHVHGAKGAGGVEDVAAVWVFARGSAKGGGLRVANDHCRMAHDVLLDKPFWLLYDRTTFRLEHAVLVAESQRIVGHQLCIRIKLFGLKCECHFFDLGRWNVYENTVGVDRSGVCPKSGSAGGVASN